MTPKEKAEKLVEKFLFSSIYFTNGYDGAKLNAKTCAILAVDEILKSCPTEPTETDWDDCGATAQYYWPQKKEDALIFWQEVKQELEEL